MFGVLAGGFAIFAGFIIFLAFTTYDQSRSGGEAEALGVIQQFETAELLPAAVHDRLTGEIVCYARSVVHQEWPQMQDERGGDTINPWAIALFRTLKLTHPRSASEQAKGQSASISARVESTRAANVANRQGQIDVALFTQWVDAYARHETELGDFYRKRFRPEFQPAFQAWVATRPRLAALFLSSLIWIATFPVSLSV